MLFVLTLERKRSLMSLMRIGVDRVFSWFSCCEIYISPNFQMESAQRRLKSMLGDMEVVTTWANETEVLLDEFDEKEKKMVAIESEKTETPKTSEQEGEEEVNKETKRQRKERIKEDKSQLREEMIALVDKLAVSKQNANVL